MWHDDAPASNRSFYLVYVSAFLATFCGSLYTGLGVAAMRYIVARGWCATSLSPSWIYGVSLVASVSLNSLWSRFLGFWVAKTGGLRPALVVTQAASAVAGSVLVHAGGPVCFGAGLVLLGLQGNPCEAVRLRIIAMHTAGEARFNHRFFHRLATWVGAAAGLFLMMILCAALPEHSSAPSPPPVTLVGGAPAPAVSPAAAASCPAADPRYDGAPRFFWQPDAPSVFIAVSCACLLLNAAVHAIFLKVEPWYLDASKDSMSVLPELYLGDTLWPYALLDKEMARWAPPKEEIEDIKLRCARVRAARMGPKVVPLLPRYFDVYLYAVSLLAAIPLGVMSASLIPVFATKVFPARTGSLCLLATCLLLFTTPPVCIVIGVSFFLCCLIMDLRLSWAMTLCGGLAPSFFRGVHGEMIGSMCLTLLGLWAACHQFGFPIKSNTIGNTYWEYILGDYFSFVVAYILMALGVKRFTETGRELQERVRGACIEIFIFFWTTEFPYASFSRRQARAWPPPTRGSAPPAARCWAPSLACSSVPRAPTSSL